MAITSLPTPAEKLASVLHDIGTLRADLEETQDWLNRNWSPDLPTPKFDGLVGRGVLVRFKVQCMTQAELAGCARALAHGAPKAGVRKKHDLPQRRSKNRAWGIWYLIRTFGLVEIQVWGPDDKVDGSSILASNGATGAVSA